VRQSGRAHHCRQRHIDSTSPAMDQSGPEPSRPLQVQSEICLTGIGPIPNFVGPGLDWPGLLWTKPCGPNRPENARSY
jgi:hypothetical protein